MNLTMCFRTLDLVKTLLDSFRSICRSFLDQLSRGHVAYEVYKAVLRTAVAFSLRGEKESGKQSTKTLVRAIGPCDYCSTGLISYRVS